MLHAHPYAAVPMHDRVRNLLVHIRDMMHAFGDPILVDHHVAVRNPAVDLPSQPWCAYDLSLKSP